jgi:hypothetical protein
LPSLALSAFYLILCHFLELFEPVRLTSASQTNKGDRPSPKPLDKSQASCGTRGQYYYFEKKFRQEKDHNIGL